MEFKPTPNRSSPGRFEQGTKQHTRKEKSTGNNMITYKQYNQWQGQYCCMKLENLEIITIDEQRGVLCRCRGCFSAEFYEPRIFKEYAQELMGMLSNSKEDRVVEKT